MTALRFQTGGRHQTYPAFLRGPRYRKYESKTNKQTNKQKSSAVRGQAVGALQQEQQLVVCGTAARGTAGVVGHCGTRYSCTWHCGTGHTGWYGALWYGVQRAVWGSAVRGAAGGMEQRFEFVLEKNPITVSPSRKPNSGIKTKNLTLSQEKIHLEFFIVELAFLLDWSLSCDIYIIDLQQGLQQHKSSFWLFVCSKHIHFNLVIIIQ